MSIGSASRRVTSSWLSVLPFLPLLAGLVLSAWRFRAQDPLGGLAFGEAGIVLMVVVATRIPDSVRGRE